MRFHHVLAVISCCMQLPTVEGGICWRTGRNGRCLDLLALGMNQEECCSISSAAWSEEDLDDGRLFMMRFIQGGVPCSTCTKSCAGVQCGLREKCRVLESGPSCVCAPKCRGLRRRFGRGRVCGNDGRTYRNVCKLQRRRCRRSGLRVAYPGRCQKSCETVECAKRGLQCVEDQNGLPHCVTCLLPCPADDQSEPSCGTDGVTYPSRCHQRRAACLLGRGIPTAYSGTCRDDLTCDHVSCDIGLTCLSDDSTGSPRCVDCHARCPASQSEQRVCASNGLTYRSWCRMRKKSCASRTYLTVRHAGKCQLQDHAGDGGVGGEGGGGGEGDGGREEAAWKLKKQEALVKDLRELTNQLAD